MQPAKQILSKIIYYLSLPLIYLGSVMPFPLLYLVSDIFFLVIYWVWGYRKSVVLENLKLSFPGKTVDEIKTLRRQYYRYLCDMFLETFKMLTISSRSMLRHCRLDEPSRQLLDELSKKKESSILTLGHKGNWEWAGSTFSLVCRQPFYIVYHPFSNRYYDRIMQKMRTRFGAQLITMTNAFKGLKGLEKDTILTAFVADQSPPPETAHWTEFMHRQTGFFKGPEKISSKLGQSVLYLSIHRVGRGYYTMHVEKLSEVNEALATGELTDRYVRMLEKDIASEPETWLWSHRRWKHKQSEVYQTPSIKTEKKIRRPMKS